MSAESLAASLPATRIQSGSPAFRSTSRAMFVGGFCTFAMLYGTQPLMPLFAQDFQLSPAAASGVVSVSTGALALCLIPASLLADLVGRRPVMNTALALGALLMLLSSLVGGFASFLWLRAVFGMVLAGLPAVAMAYLGEEIDAPSLGHSMGLYIAGNALGGMSGRFIAAGLAESLGWRGAVLVLALMGLTGAWLYWRALPASRHFQPRPHDWQRMRADLRSHLQDGGLPWLFLTAFLLAGCFVSLYNYLEFRLIAAPYRLSHAALGWIFSLYVVGMGSSAWVGKMADRVGRRNVLWLMVIAMLLGLALTLLQPLWLVIVGIALFTFGFFAAHSVGSSWVGLRARSGKALATALYLTAYYLGSSIIGSASGLVWRHGAWNAVAALLCLGLVAVLAIALKLRGLAPVASPT